MLSVSVMAVALAHEIHPFNQVKLTAQEAKFKKINEVYVKQIKPIFQGKCFDCHSQYTNFPWYYPLPLIKSAIDRDIQKAKKHLDFSEDFPFKGHGGPLEDLQAIDDVIHKGSMPPLKYRLLHFSSAVTLEENEKIIKWVMNSRSILEDH